MSQGLKGKICSMTGFASVEGNVSGSTVRLELKALNHRFLDIKVRLPREYSEIEAKLRQYIQGRISRGSLDIKFEKLVDLDDSSADFQANLSVAAHYYEALITLQKTLGLSDEIRTTDILQFPDVICRSKTASTDTPEKLWNEVEPLVSKAIDEMSAMRNLEGEKLADAMLATCKDLGSFTGEVRNLRKKLEKEFESRLTQKIKRVFEAHPIANENVQATLESRIAQELALILDRTDVEEELTRLAGHIEHFDEVITQTKGPVGRKLEFIIQEINREISTLGNKAQDSDMSEKVVQMKVMVEQLREQVLNLE